MSPCSGARRRCICVAYLAGEVSERSFFVQFFRLSYLRLQRSLSLSHKHTYTYKHTATSPDCVFPLTVRVYTMQRCRPKRFLHYFCVSHHTSSGWMDFSGCVHRAHSQHRHGHFSAGVRGREDSNYQHQYIGARKYARLGGARTLTPNFACLCRSKPLLLRNGRELRGFLCVSKNPVHNFSVLPSL